MTKKYSVLLVEDDKSIREYLRLRITEGGFSVYEAEDGEEGINSLNDPGYDFDVILCDLRMPKKSGVEVAEFNFMNKFIPFVIYTAVTDSELALKLLPLGVQDYLIKPTKAHRLLSVLKNAINRRSLSTYLKPDENPYAGNVGTITIASRMEEINRAINWIESQLNQVMNKTERNRFIIHITELLLNAHEHGNLQITEKQKGDLLNKNEFDHYLKEAEKRCVENIQVSLSVLQHSVSVNIIDEGYGFDYKAYLNMSDEEIMKRLLLPNGKGILMINEYFDAIQYRKGGSNVTVTKNIRS